MRRRRSCVEGRRWPSTQWQPSLRSDFRHARERLHRHVRTLPESRLPSFDDASPASPAAGKFAQFLRKRVCATPEDDIAATSVFISRSASPTSRSIPPSPVALQARQPCRETRAKENGLFYALSFAALRGVVAQQRSSPHRFAAPAAALAAFARDAAGKNFRRGC